MAAETKKRIGRVPLLVAAMACLAAGVWGGLVRLPMNLPLPGGNAHWITLHGPLMVCGFLGTLIALERAVGLRSWWTYAAPLLIAVSGGMFGFGITGKWPLIVLTAGSALFWMVTLWVVRLQTVAFTVVMSGGALAWTIGNALWWADWPFYRIVPWWITFLALTIVGERLDLSRFQKPSAWSAPLLTASLVLYTAGLVWGAFQQIPGERLMGAGLLALSAWLGRFDIARRTIKQPGLTRFMAAGLLSGYVWLGLSGVLMMSFSPLVSGFRYDSVLHAFFVGFVFSMIFAHAPVIFPAVLLVQPVFTPRFYAHLILLQVGLVLRIGGDLANSAPGRQWGAVLNAIAIALFLLNTISAFLIQPRAGVKPKAGL